MGKMTLEFDLVEYDEPRNAMLAMKAPDLQGTIHDIIQVVRRMYRYPKDEWGDETRAVIQEIYEEIYGAIDHNNVGEFFV